MIPSLLVIVPCGKRKVWKQNPGTGPTFAHSAYCGAFFSVNRQYAEHFAQHWVILSAKYGFILPDFVIPEDYNISFKSTPKLSIAVVDIQRQVCSQGLKKFDLVICLGGQEYREIVRQVFAPHPIICPFEETHSQGEMMQATKRAIRENTPWPTK